MLSPLWWLPVAVAAAGAVVLGRGARHLLEEVARLQASIAELRQVRPLVADVKAELAALDRRRRGMEGHR
jgi:hypothetical protein